MKKNKEIEIELVELKNRYEQLIHSTIDGVFLKDFSGRYQFINPAAAKAMGKKVKDFIGKTDFSIFPKEVAKGIVRIDRRVIKTKKTVKFEKKLVLKGKEIYLETIKYPVLDEEGKAMLLCGMVRDITNQKKDEVALARRIKELSALYQVSKDIDKAKNIKELFKDITGILCSIMENPDFFFIVWMFDDENTRQIKAYCGVSNLKEAKSFFNRKGNFIVPLKADGKKEGGFVAGYKDQKKTITKEWKEFIREIAELIGKEIERRKIKGNIDRMFIEVVKTLSAALDARDHYTVNHSKRISNNCRLIVKRLNLRKKEKENIVLAALLHDIGKIGISDGILSKPGRLTPEEFDKVKQHPLISESILRPIEALKGTLKIIRHHHERYDGTGYPDGLKGEKIPIGARILGVCDAHDAMVSERPYRSAMSTEKAIMELKGNSGIQFDPKIVKIVIDLVGKKNFQ